MEGLLKFTFFCLFIQKGHGTNSHLSSINTEGRPILRSQMDVPDAFQSAEVIDHVPTWLGALRARIERLVSRHGYEYAKPFISDAVDATEKKQSVLLDVKVFRNGKSHIMYENRNMMRMRADSSEALRHDKGPEPEWLEPFKTFVSYLLNLYGPTMDKLDPHIAPVAHSLQGKYNVDIINIDADDNGDLTVNWVDLSKKSQGQKRQRARGWNRHRYNDRGGRGVTQIYENE